MELGFENEKIIACHNFLTQIRDLVLDFGILTPEQIPAIPPLLNEFKVDSNKPIDEYESWIAQAGTNVVYKNHEGDYTKYSLDDKGDCIYVFVEGRCTGVLNFEESSHYNLGRVEIEILMCHGYNQQLWWALSTERDKGCKDAEEKCKILSEEETRLQSEFSNLLIESQKLDLPKHTDFEVYESDVELYLPMLFKIENELNLRCYQRDTDNPERIYLCWYDQSGNVNIQLWREHGGRELYWFYISAWFEVVDNKITDGFTLDVEPHRACPDTIEFIIRALVEKAKGTTPSVLSVAVKEQVTMKTYTFSSEELKSLLSYAIDGAHKPYKHPGLKTCTVCNTTFIYHTNDCLVKKWEQLLSEVTNESQ
jgi:hypothetical protein